MGNPLSTRRDSDGSAACVPVRRRQSLQKAARGAVLISGKADGKQRHTLETPVSRVWLAFGHDLRGTAVHSLRSHFASAISPPPPEPTVDCRSLRSDLCHQNVPRGTSTLGRDVPGSGRHVPPTSVVFLCDHVLIPTTYTPGKIYVLNFF